MPNASLSHCAESHRWRDGAAIPVAAEAAKASSRRATENAEKILINRDEGDRRDRENMEFEILDMEP